MPIRIAAVSMGTSLGTERASTRDPAIVATMTRLTLHGCVQRLNRLQAYRAKAPQPHSWRTRDQLAYRPISGVTQRKHVLDERVQFVLVELEVHFARVVVCVAKPR